MAACACAAPGTLIPIHPATQAPAPQALAIQATPENQATSAQALATVAPAKPPTQAAQPVIATEFTPSNPAQVSLAAGRPQFVEFFASW
jgi:hypothetical protein